MYLCDKVKELIYGLRILFDPHPVYNGWPRCGEKPE
jgi:hypothetical protein